MAAPVPASTGTYLTGASTTAAAAAVPSGVSAGDVILVFIYKENAETITPPSGFTQVTNSPVATTGTVTQQSVWWKRATGARLGHLLVHVDNRRVAGGCSGPVHGCITSGGPTEIDNFAQVSTSTTTSPAVSGTTTGVMSATATLTTSGDQVTQHANGDPQLTNYDGAPRVMGAPSLAYHGRAEGTWQFVFPAHPGRQSNRR